MYRLLAGLWLVVCACAADAQLDRGTLQGIKAINVVVDPLDPPLEKIGLSKDGLRAQVEDRLRAAGIIVDRDAREFLGIRITSVEARKGVFSLCFSEAVYQPVLLARDQKVRTATQTWEVDSILVVPSKGLQLAATQQLEQMADQFLTAFKSVNPQ